MIVHSYPSIYHEKYEKCIVSSPICCMVVVYVPTKLGDFCWPMFVDVPYTQMLHGAGICTPTFTPKMALKCG